jgi:hypothetical protein
MSRVFQSDYTSVVKMYTLAANTNHSWSKQTQTRIILANTGKNLGRNGVELIISHTRELTMDDRFVTFAT